MKKIEIEIPIYRAKKIDSDDNIKSQSYIKKLIGGNYHHYLVKYYSPDYEDVEIDPSTLAIHFPDMLDRQGNKIFASLSEDGKGGDICEIDKGERVGVFIYHKYAMCIDINVIEIINDNHNFIGVTPQSYKRRTKTIKIKE